ncbi:MAG: replicative DNA helicase [Candidatus Nealsonbacteria bacterium]|nr:replicative DNA helicase [Candidatus Nealsonbacteria bacterium]
MPEDLKDKLPPQSIEAEQSLLGSLMLDKDAIIRVADLLTAESFYQKAHQEIYGACRELFEKGEPIDLLSVANRLKEKGILEQIGGNSYLSELINSVATPAHASNYGKIVHRKRILRDLISASHDISRMGYDESEDINVLLDKAEKRIFDIAQKGLSQDFVPVKATLEDAFERIDRLSKQGAGLRGLATGFNSLDNMLAGLQKSDLIILAARPSLGKSALALNMAANIAVNENVPVGIFSLEMSKDQVVDRLISSFSMVDLWKLRTGKLSNQGEDNDFTKIREAMGILSEAPIYIDDASSPTILQMKAMCRRLQAQKGLGLVIVDYLQLVEPLNPDAPPVQQVTESSRALKGLARELNVPVMVVSQLSRAVEQRSPQIPRLSDLRLSGCLTGDTLLMRADTGEREEIKNLVGKENIPIFTLNENWKLSTAKISKVFSSGKKKTYLLKTRSGFKIKASVNHPFRKLDGWLPLEGLKIGDKIATPKKLSPSLARNEMKKEEIILLAHLLGDGCVVEHQPIHYTSGDKVNIEIVGKTAKKLFKIKPRVVPQKNWHHIYLPSPYYLARGKHHPIINWFSGLGMKKAKSFEKYIPQAVFALDNENIALFLRHLWSTDGNISFKQLKGRKPSAAIYYASTSEKLAMGVKHLLLRFGIRSRIKPQKKQNYRICYQVQIQGKEHQLRFLKEIGVFGKKEKISQKLIKNLEEIIPNTNLDVVPKEIWQNVIDGLRQDRGLSWGEFCTGINMSSGGKNSLFRNGVGTLRLERIANYLAAPKQFCGK